MPGSRKELKSHLDRLYETFDLEFLATDPLEFVHRYRGDEDREVVGLVSSALAYGRVAGIKRSLERVFSVMGPSPRGFVDALTPAKGLRLLNGFTHRFNDGRDVTALLLMARRMIERSGSIGEFFLEGYDPAEKNVKGAIESFTSRALALDTGGVYGRGVLPGDAGVRFFLPAPSGGSACKRLCLYLRWMVRPDDGLDFGIWTGVSPSKLVIPLDTHIARIARNIGLTSRTTPGWRMAEEITDALAELDPDDPTRYDFSLCRLGILDRCPRDMDPDRCEACMIREVCVL